MTTMASNARDIAVRSLRDRAGNVSAHLRRLLDKERLARAEAAFAMELALGALRRRRTLETVLGAFLKQPGRKLPAPIGEILHLAMFQILFLDGVPTFAAVNEAVEQTKRLGHNRRSGLVNGVLRSVTRCLSELREGPPPFSADVVPISPNSYRTIGRDVFADPVANPAEYLGGAFSLPDSLAQRWVDRFSALAGAVAVAAHANVRAPLILRINALRADVETVLARLGEEGAAARPHANGCSIVLTAHANVTELGVFRDGLVQPQDPSAVAVVLSAKPEPGMSVLDFCAAPGTKTTHLAECMQNRGSITAVDVSAEKLQRIETNCRRLGVEIVRTMLAEEIGALTPQGFDLVLVDVPCSNTGVLARRPEARWRFGERALGKLVGDQKHLASAAAAFVAPGGRLVYSTCSIEPEEDDGVSHWLDREHRGLRLVSEDLTLPAGATDPIRWRDGGYVAILEAR